MTHLHSVGALCAAAAFVAVSGAVASAQPSTAERTLRRGDLTYTSASIGQDSVLAVEAPGVRVEKRVTSTGGGTIVVSTGTDRVQVEVTPEALRVSRGPAGRAISARTASAAEVQAVRALLRDAPAVHAVARLRALVEADGPAPLVSALAFVSMLAGDGAAMRRVTTAASARPGIQFARDAVACWSSYQNSINIFFIDLQSCLYDNQWNMFMQYGCNFVYVTQSEVAWFSLIACAGGLPGL